MSERILNFSEFSKKYSSGNNDRSLDDLKGSAANFEEGFDDDTYDGNIGPNRPVSSGDAATPAQPGDDGTSFDSDIDMELNPPEEITEPETVAPEDDVDTDETDDSIEAEDTEDVPAESEPDPELEDTEGDTDETEEEDDKDETEDDEEDDDEDVPEPEAGANPKKPKIIEESNQSPELMNFDKFFESLAPDADAKSDEDDETPCEGCDDEDCDCNK